MADYGSTIGNRQSLTANASPPVATCAPARGDGRRVSSRYTPADVVARAAMLLPPNGGLLTLARAGQPSLEFPTSGRMTNHARSVPRAGRTAVMASIARPSVKPQACELSGLLERLEFSLGSLQDGVVGVGAGYDPFGFRLPDAPVAPVVRNYAPSFRRAVRGPCASRGDQAPPSSRPIMGGGMTTATSRLTLPATRRSYGT